MYHFGISHNTIEVGGLLVKRDLLGTSFMKGSESMCTKFWKKLLS